MKKKFTAKQVLAIIGIVIIVGLYVTSLVLALIHNDMAFKLLKISMLCTMIVPIFIYLIMMFMKLGHGSDKPEPKVYADEKDDPYTEEDFKDN